MSGYWLVIAPPAILAMGGLACAVAYFTPKGAHRGDPPGPVEVTPDVRAMLLPVAETAAEPPWDGGGWESELPELPEWAKPEADRVTLYGGASGSMGSEYTYRPDPGVLSEYQPAWWPSPNQEATIRRELHEVDETVLVEDWVRDGMQVTWDGLPGEVGAGDESEACGPPAPPAPHWLDDQLSDLFAWVRTMHAGIEAS